MKNCLFLFYFLCLSQVFAEEIRTPDAFFIDANLTGLPSTLINGCVNVITGTYHEQEEDLKFVGGLSIPIQRSYSSNYTQDQWFEHYKSLGNGWGFNYDGAIRFTFLKRMDGDEGTHKRYYFYGESYEGGGVCFLYEDPDRIRHKSDHDPFKLKLSKKVMRHGFTNCGSGQISARTNPRNNKIYERVNEQKKPLFELVQSSGSTLIFQKNDKDKEEDGIFYLKKHLTPNQGFHTYEHDKENRLKKIHVHSATGKVLGAVDIEYKDRNFTDEVGMTITSSHGGKAEYTFTKHKKRYFLDNVKKEDGTFHQYSYESRSKHRKEGLHQINQKVVNGRVHDIEYYHRGKEKIYNETVKIDDLKDRRHGRVKCLKSPSGPNGEAITTHTFLYKDNLTHLFDAHHNRTDYAYDNCSRLTDVIKVADNREYCRDRYHWTGEGHLISHLMTSDGMNHFCHFFDCDEKGNLKGEWLFGNLTGRNIHPVVVDKTGTPIQNGCEGHCKRREYTTKHHLLKLEDDGRKWITHGYVREDLLEHRFVQDKELILLREFYEYNEDGILIKKIVDDGVTKDKNNLQGVTERHITYITPSVTPFGLPATVEERYFDLKTNQEISLAKEENHYSLKGELINQKKYDCNGVLAFTKQWEYNNQGKCIREVNALGYTITRSYDVHGNVIEEIGPKPNCRKKFTYDNANRLRIEEEFHEDHHFVKTYAYNALGQKVSETDICGNVTTYGYDALGRVTEVKKPAFTSFEGHLLQPSTKTHYNSLGHAVLVEDESGQQTKTLYTIRGTPYHIQYPDRSEEHKEYTPDGLLKKSIDRKGFIVEYTHDALGRITKEEHFDPSHGSLREKNFIYNSFHLIKEIDFLGNETEYSYDLAGRLAKVNKSGRITEHKYDALGRASHTIVYSSSETFFATIKEYDVLNQIIEERIEDEKGVVQKRERYAYDCEGNRTHVISNEGNCNETQYNGFKKPIKIIDAKGNETHIFYKFGSFMTQELIDPNGNKVITTYDTHGRVAKVEHFNTLGDIVKEQSLFYDVRGCLTTTQEKVIPEKTSHTIISKKEYDSMKNVVAFIEASGTKNQKKTTWHYNGKGQKDQVVQPNGVIIYYSYDSVGRLISQKSSDKTVDDEFIYDLSDHLIQCTDHAHDSTTTRVYDIHDNIIQEKLGNGHIFHYTFDGIGRVTTITYPDQTSAHYTYEGAYLKSVQRNGFTHTYDSYNLSSKLQHATLIGSCGDITQEYDKNGALISLKAPTYSSHLTYDSVGNLTSKQLQTTSKKEDLHYSYNSLYQLEKENEHSYQYDSLYNCINKDNLAFQTNDLHQLLHDGKNAYQYDLNGNMTKKNNDTYTYDALNRLIEILQPDQKITFTYDSLNRRLTKKVNDSTTHYLYQGDDEVGATNSSGTIQELRLLGLRRSGENNASILIELNHTTYCPIHDDNGNIISLLNATTSQETESYTYSAFGEEPTNSYINPWRFSSKRTDPETHLIFFGRRYYDPTIARWITCDPLSDRDGPNLYAYLHNNPLTNFDAYGLFGRGNDKGVYFADNYESRRNVNTLSLEMMDKMLDIVDDPTDIATGSFTQLGHSSRFNVGENNLTNGCSIGFINGIFNSLSDCIQSATILSKMAGNAMINGVHNVSYGIDDLSRAFHGLYNKMATDPVRLLHQQWNEFLANSNMPFLQVCHSEGAIHVLNALLTYPEDLRKRIIVLAVAPAAYISRDLCMRVTHLVSNGDIIPRLDQEGRINCHEDIHYLERHPDSNHFCDHAFESPTYQKPMKDFINQYIQDYRS